MSETSESLDEQPKHLQDAPRVRRNTFKAQYEGKTIDVVYASFAACLEFENNALKREYLNKRNN